jgi:hypothetical protein
MKRLTAAAMAAALLAPVASTAGSLPIGFEAKGGFGAGYYSMAEFDDNLQEIREDLELNFSDLTSGFTVLLEGRIWLFGRVAGCAGYEHFWAEHIVPTGSSSSVTYKAPADLVSLGGVVHIFRVPTVLDINAGLKGSFAKVIYGTDESGRFVEYKANDYGWDIFGEINTNFMNPVQVGFTLGYRSVKVDGFEDKFGNEPIFTETGDPVTMNYSGAYIYFTAGVAVW